MPVFICLRSYRPLTLSVAAALLLAGCTTTPPAAQPEPAPVPVDYAPYDSSVLADLLVAEVAMQRHVWPLGQSYYRLASADYRSPEVSAQAARLAALLQDPEQTLAQSERWLSLAPDSGEAHQLAALANIQLGRRDAAAHHIDRLLALEPRIGLTRLVAHAEGLDQDASANLMAALAQLTDRYPDQGALWYARALHLRSESDMPGSLAAVERAIRLQPRHEEARLLKGRLLYEAGNTRAALRHLRREVRRAPDSLRPRVIYVRYLLEAGDADQAAKQLQILTEKFPDDQDLQLSLGLFALQQDHRDTGRAILEALLEAGYQPSEMQLYLGQLEELEGRPQLAIEHYLQVQDGDNVLPAQVQAARLMADIGQYRAMHRQLANLRQQFPQELPRLYAMEAELLSLQQPEAALLLLNEALETLPDHPSLLYGRAMLAEQIGLLEVTFADLRRILVRDPNNTEALNALGYTLADRSDQYEEAYGLIQRALAKQPDNPAILDSMGWVLFKLGRAEEAVPYLERAYRAYPDAEVAAHLGEVLWHLGRQQEARSLWRDALSMDEGGGHPVLDSTLQRLLNGVAP
ncbi:tetratricopeptide repeat protein [Isoalcanivorax beigongshangi]|uniref:Tetratricopeptide repeat protein n=1 Tax=Isoalcanivorax beigongshangi TaxID=3238810 RepID=A0ABV4AFT0_9GAMM